MPILGADSLAVFVARAPRPWAAPAVRTVLLGLYDHVMGAMVAALLDGRLSTIQAINNAVAFLATNARRAHPQRDRRIGRLELSLEPVLNQGLST